MICCFYTASEINAAKKCLAGLFRDPLLDTGLTIDRRASTSRPAHEADLDDVIAIINYLDSKDLLQSVSFAAVNLSRLPGYAPEEINLCTVVDRHVKLSAVVTQLAAEVKSLSGQPASSVQQQAAQESAEVLVEVKKTVAQTDNKIDSMQDALTNVSAYVQSNWGLCRTLSPRSAAERKMQAQNLARHDSITQSREKNVILFGVPENKTRSEWNKCVVNILDFVAGRRVETEDAFRLGAFCSGKCRPVLVKDEHMGPTSCAE